jgi:hypothetical protein
LHFNLEHVLSWYISILCYGDFHLSSRVFGGYKSRRICLPSSFGVASYYNGRSKLKIAVAKPITKMVLIFASSAFLDVLRAQSYLFFPYFLSLFSSSSRFRRARYYGGAVPFSRCTKLISSIRHQHGTIFSRIQTVKE